MSTTTTPQQQLQIPSPREHRQQNSACCKSLFRYCCPASTRFLILLLSFGVLNALLANLQLFNLAVLFTSGEQQKMLLGEELMMMRNWGDGQIGGGESVVFAHVGGNGNVGNSTTGSTVLPPNGLHKRQATTIFIRAEEEKKEEKEEEEEMEKFYPSSDQKEDEAATTEIAEFPVLMDQTKIRRLAQSLLFSVPGIAIMISHFPCYILLRRFGSFFPILCSLVCSALLTGAFPYILSMGYYTLPVLMVSRMLLGICFAPAFTFLGQMAQRWSTTGEQQFFVLSGFLAILFVPASSWLPSTFLLTSSDQKTISIHQVFTAHAASTLLLALLWIIFYRDRPQTHSLVNGEELNLIVKGKPRQKRTTEQLDDHHQQNNNLPNTLACLLVRSTSAWAVWISAFCYFFPLLVLLNFFPLLLQKTVRQTLLNDEDLPLVRPFVALLFVHLFSHYTASFLLQLKRRKGVVAAERGTLLVRIFNTCAFALSAIAFLLTAAMMPGGNNGGGGGKGDDEFVMFEEGDDEQQQQQFSSSIAGWRLWLFTFALIPLGLSSLGFIKSIVASGGAHFAQYIVAHLQVPFGLAYALGPTLLFSSISGTSTFIHWRLLFLACALILLLGLAVFVVLGRGTPTSWAEQWAEEAAGDMPLLFVKFSPQHLHHYQQNQPLASFASEAAAVAASVRFSEEGEEAEEDGEEVGENLNLGQH